MPKGVITLLAFLLAAIVMGCATPAFAQSGKRVALVIGNADYKQLPVFRGADRDANDIGASLERLGFEVTRAINADLATMRSSIAAFQRSASNADAAAVFYSGFSLRYRGSGYLVPVDATLKDDASFEWDTLQLAQVIGALARSRASFLIVDSCGVDQLAGAFQRQGGAATPGLGDIPGRADSLIAVASAASAESCGDARNSVLADSLLAEIDRPGLDARILFRRAEQLTRHRSGGRQALAISSGLTQPFAFAQGDLPNLAFRRLGVEPDVAVMRGYVDKYGDNPLSAVVKTMMVQKEQAPQRPGASPQTFERWRGFFDERWTRDRQEKASASRRNALEGRWSREDDDRQAEDRARIAREQEERRKREAEVAAAEQKRLAEIAAAEKKRQDEENARIAREQEEKRQREAEAAAAEQKRLAELAAAEKKRQDEERVRIAREQDEQRKREAEAAAAEQKRLADLAAAAEKKRQDEERVRIAREQEEQRRKDAEIAEQKRQAEIAAAAEKKRQDDERARIAREQEEQRRKDAEIAEQKRQAEIAAAEKQRQEEEKARIAREQDAQRRREAELAEQKRQAEIAAAEQKRQAELAAAEKKRQDEERARIAREEDEKRKAELAAAAAEQKRLADLAVAEKRRADQERADREKAEREEKARIAREQEEQRRKDAEIAAAEKRRVDQERADREKAEREEKARIARQQEEQRRKDAEFAAAEKRRVDQERADREKAEREEKARIAREQEDQRKKQAELAAAEKKRQEDEEKLRVAREREEQQKRQADADLARRQQQAEADAEARRKAEEQRLAALSTPPNNTTQPANPQTSQQSSPVAGNAVTEARQFTATEQRLAQERLERERRAKGENPEFTAPLPSETTPQIQTEQPQGDTKLANLAPAPTDRPPPNPNFKGDSPESIKAAQQELKRLGCYSGNINGNLNNGTKSALDTAGKKLGQTASLQPLTEEGLRTLREHQETLCPPATARRPQRDEEEEDEPARPRARPRPAQTQPRPVRQAEPAPRAAPAPRPAPAPVPSTPRPSTPRNIQLSM